MNPGTGELTFVAPPDFENPTDAGADNVYNVEVTADDGDGVRIQTTLRLLAREAGLTMLEAHRALHQLLDKKVLRLRDDVLVAPSVEALTSCLDGPV